MRRVGVHGAGFTPITQMAPCPAGAVAAGGAVSYLLRATFDADDVGYANGQVLNTEPEMGANFAGQLTVAELVGTIGIVSDKCAFTSAGGWTNQGFYSQGIARAFGYGLLFELADTVAGQHMVMGLSDAGAVNYPPSNGYIIRRMNTNVCLVTLDVGGAEILSHSVFTWANATTYLFAMILGGYDVNGMPWRTGEATAGYLYGVAIYVQGGAWGGDWHLLWRLRSLNTATMYAMLSNWSCTGTTDDVRVPDLDLSGAYVINSYSTFDAANGTSLDAITPEIGGAWTEDDGTWDIQGNEANISVAAGAAWFEGASVETNISDGLIEGTVTKPAAGLYVGLRFRYDAAAPTMWLAHIQPSSNNLWLWEYNAGWTARGGLSYAIGTGTPYHLMVSMDGQRIEVCIEDDAAFTYLAAALNETKTLHGIGGNVVDCRIDNFVVYPKTNPAYDTALDGV